MLTSKDRILTTHCGSLPRPAALSDLLLRQEAGEKIDTQSLHRQTAAAVVAGLAFGSLALSDLAALGQLGILCGVGEVLTAVAILLVGRPVLLALRRCARRAAFDTVPEFAP